MLDRLQHLKLFLSGCNVPQEDIKIVLDDMGVRSLLGTHPMNTVRLLKLIEDITPLDEHCKQQFSTVFGRYR